MFSSLWIPCPSSRHLWIGTHIGGLNSPHSHPNSTDKASSERAQKLPETAWCQNIWLFLTSLLECLAQTCVYADPRGEPCIPSTWHSDLPAEARERHCPVMGLYSWFSSAHTHRKEPSTFSQKASPHTPLSSSHSFTSGRGSTDQVRRMPRFWQLFVLPAVPRPAVFSENTVIAVSSQTPLLPKVGLHDVVCREGSGKCKAKLPNFNSGF